MNKNDFNTELNNYKDIENNPNKKLLAKYIHDIRNYRELSPEILQNINNFSYEDRLLILQTYNDVIKYVNDILSS